MRVTSALFVSALVRRVFAAGAFAVILRKGAEEAGAILVMVDRLDGSADLYAQAPQTAFDEERPTDRLFTRIEAGIDAERRAVRLASELRFDADLWVVEIEDRAGRPFLDLAREA